MLNWEDSEFYEEHRQLLEDGFGWSTAKYGFLEIWCWSNNKKYKDGTMQYKILLTVPSADSREFITLTKIRGNLSNAKAKAEAIFENFPNDSVLK